MLCESDSGFAAAKELAEALGQKTIFKMFLPKRTSPLHSSKKTSKVRCTGTSRKDEKGDAGPRSEGVFEKNACTHHQAAHRRRQHAPVRIRSVRVETKGRRLAAAALLVRAL
mmetsp:Transcript_14322/g.21907  ORF Transcript_14322/g.21907 Transcript_14322/m.21907 type:complete len:112 (-) Transcript_14322:60-395(-)